MDLGKCKLRRTKCDILKNAYHARHGLVWSDGQTIWLTGLRIEQQQLVSTPPKKLGHFQQVTGLYWSSTLHSSDVTTPGDVIKSNTHDVIKFPKDTVPSNEHCYLCVVHGDHVTLWHVTGSAPALSLKQLRKINASPLPQGCLWHPKSDILCILTREKASFYFQHTHKKGSYALPPLESGSLSCGCWSRDGKKLLLGVGTIVLVYRWEDIEKCVSDYTIIAWKIPNAEGQLLSIRALTDDKYVCTTEPELRDMCAPQPDLFQMPEGGAVDIIRSSHTQALLSLQPSQWKAGSSQLVLFELEDDSMEPHKLCAFTLSTLPCGTDFLLCQGDDTVILGSNTMATLQVYHLKENALSPVPDIVLDTDERPVGLCAALSDQHNNQHGNQAAHVIVAVAKNCSTAVAIPTIATTCEKTVQLRYLPLSGCTTMQESSLDKLRENGQSRLLREIHLPDSDERVQLLRLSQLTANNTHVQDKPEQKQEKYSGLTTPDQLLDSLISSSTARSLVTSHPSLHDSAVNLSNGDNSADNKSVLNLSNADNSNGDISRETKSAEDLSNAECSRADKSVVNISNGNISRDDKSYPLACMINRQLPEIPIAETENYTHLKNLLKDKNPSTKAMVLDEVDVCSDSSEFHLVLPNSHSDFIAFEENNQKKVVLMDSGDSHVSYNGDLQTETVSFNDTKAAFSNTVKSYFRNDSCDKDTYTSVDSQKFDKGILPSVQSSMEQFEQKSNKTGANSSEFEHENSGAFSATQSVSSSQDNFRTDTTQRNGHLATNISDPIMTSCTSSLASSRANLSESHITQELQHLKSLVKSQGEEISKLTSHLYSLTSAAQAPSRGCSSFTSPALATLIYKHLQHHTTPQTDPSTDSHSANQSAAAVDAGSSSCRKTFLLDEGRLKLVTVLDAFQLNTLEIISGESSFIVSANSEGYIPLTFDKNSSVEVTGTPIPPTDKHSNA